MTQRLFMFMSSFGKLHEDEFITIQVPGTSPYPAFDLRKFQQISADEWKASYVNRLSEGGAEVLRERSEITVQEIE